MNSKMEHLNCKSVFICVGVIRVLKCLKEELAWVINKQY